MDLSKKMFLLGITLLCGVGVALLSTGKAYAAVSARNGTSVLGGYVELGGTLRRNTSIRQGNNYKIGIGTTSPLNMLHLNSGACNVAMRVQSTDPYALITFQDNLISDVNNPPYVGGNGDSIVMGMASIEWASISEDGISVDPLGQSLTEMYINLDVVSGTPNSADCVNPTKGPLAPFDNRLGRMIYDSTGNNLFICTVNGWSAVALGGPTGK